MFLLLCIRSVCDCIYCIYNILLGLGSPPHCRYHIRSLVLFVVVAPESEGLPQRLCCIFLCCFCIYTWLLCFHHWLWVLDFEHWWLLRFLLLFPLVHYIIDLGFLSLCWMMSSFSPSLLLISVLIMILYSSLSVSIIRPLSLIDLTAWIPTLMSVGFSLLFSWLLICSGVIFLLSVSVLFCIFCCCLDF